MSLRGKHSSRPGLRSSTGGFSSVSLGSYSIPRMSQGGMNTMPITAVTVNKSLLTPISVDIDPGVHAVRQQEKEQIKSLNNRFASFIDKVSLSIFQSQGGTGVELETHLIPITRWEEPLWLDCNLMCVPKVRYLEQQNKMLETKWKLLQDQTASTANAEPLLRAYIANMQRQLEFFNSDKNRLDIENGAMHANVNNYKKRQDPSWQTRERKNSSACELEPSFQTWFPSLITDWVIWHLCAISGMNRRSTREMMERMSLSC